MNYIRAPVQIAEILKNHSVFFSLCIGVKWIHEDKLNKFIKKSDNNCE
jgi:hypothetical protein